MLYGLVLLLATSAVAGGLFHSRVMTSRAWRATVTPLASIIGSGFLVAGPILGAAVGSYAWMAMAALCVVAYLFGSAIRYNILHVEPVLRANPPAVVATLERASELALALAYFVSVAYYLNLFSAFGLRLFGVVDPVLERIGATAAIAVIGAIGAVGGLRALERVEVAAVGLKLAVIAGVCVALGVALGVAWHDETLHWPAGVIPTDWQELRVLAGLVILVQGFETSRFLGAAYEPELRVRTMRRAQWIATGIYLAFIVLVTRLLAGDLPREGGETYIVDLLRGLSPLAAPMVIIAALASQSSAAVADMNGAGGLLAESVRNRIRVRTGNLITALVAIALTWTSNIYGIITMATRVFVVYYCLQSLQAVMAAWQRGQWLRAALYGAGALLAGAIAVLALPVEV